MKTFLVVWFCVSLILLLTVASLASFAYLLYLVVSNGSLMAGTLLIALVSFFITAIITRGLK